MYFYCICKLKSLCTLYLTGIGSITNVRLGTTYQIQIVEPNLPVMVVTLMVAFAMGTAVKVSWKSKKIGGDN